MDGKSKIFGAGLLGVVVGLAGGIRISDAVRTIYLGGLGDRAVIDLRTSLSTIATAAGVTRSPQEARAMAEEMIALRTITVGQAFDRIHEDYLHNEAVRMVNIIDRNEELRASAQNEIEAWARDVRHCIIQKSENPEDVVACVNAATNAPKITPKA